MRVALVTTGVLLSAAMACAVSVTDGPGLLCDEGHLCTGGRVCLDGRCVDAGEGLFNGPCDDPRVADGPNLIPNGSFESSELTVTDYAGSQIRRVDGGYHGAKALEVLPGTASGRFGFTSRTFVAPDAGQRYCLSAWVRSERSKAAVMWRIRETTDAGVAGASEWSEPLGLSETWQRIPKEYVIRAANVGFYIQILSELPEDGGEPFIVDVMSLKLGP